jgi:hypothetical protein
VIEMISYGESNGFTKGLCYRIARASRGHDYLVCSHCGWPWAGLNRCLNDECRGFCTWSEIKGEMPTSWVPHPESGLLPHPLAGGVVPRMPGQPSEYDHTEAIERLRGVLRSIGSTEARDGDGSGRQRIPV